MKFIQIREHNNRQKAYMYTSERDLWEIPLETAKDIISQYKLTEDKIEQWGSKFFPTVARTFYMDE